MLVMFCIQAVCSAATRRNYSSHARRWLDFESARAVVRAVGLRTVREFLVWSRSGRPQDVPGDPRKFYANEGWLGFPDFLGCVTRPSRKLNQEELTPHELYRRNMGLAKLRDSAAAGEAFVEEIGRHAPDVLFLRLPRGSDANLLFRLRQPGDEVATDKYAKWCLNPSGDWWGIRLRTTSLAGPAGQVTIRLRQERDETFDNTGVVCVCGPLKFMRLLGPSDVPQKGFYVTWQRDDVTPVVNMTASCGSLPPCLANWAQSCQAKPFLHWLREGRGSGGPRISRSLSETLQAKLFFPCGFALRFPRDDDIGCNMLVEGRRVLHRHAKAEAGRVGFAVGLYRREGRKTIPFSRATATMDVVLVTVWDVKRLVGCFIFSKEDLAHCFSSGDGKGQQRITIYLPANKGLKRDQAQANDHEHLFVDLRGHAAQYVPRFRELLERATEE